MEVRPSKVKPVETIGLGRLRKKAEKTGVLNRAVLWHLQLSLRLLDRLGYQMTAINVAAAIDALTTEAASDPEISRMDLDRGDRGNLILEIFEKHGHLNSGESDSAEQGHFDDGNSKET